MLRDHKFATVVAKTCITGVIRINMVVVVTAILVLGRGNMVMLEIRMRWRFVKIRSLMVVM